MNEQEKIEMRLHKKNLETIQNSALFLFSQEREALKFAIEYLEKQLNQV